MKDWISTLFFLTLIVINFPLLSQQVDVGELANFAKYASANKEVMQLENNGERVVFMGNSITESWPHRSKEFWNNKNYICRGISGQVSAQMLLRFRNDVVDLEPEIVVILAGTNDIAQNRGFVPLEKIADNIKSMAEMADYHGIKVILCSVLPAIDFPWRPGLKPADKIVDLNDMLKEYSDSKGIPWVDYYSAMVDDQKGLQVPAFTSEDDLVHPNEAGYKVMEKLIVKALDQITDH